MSGRRVEELLFCCCVPSVAPPRVRRKAEGGEGANKLLPQRRQLPEPSERGQNLHRGDGWRWGRSYDNAMSGKVKVKIAFEHAGKPPKYRDCRKL